MEKSATNLATKIGWISCDALTQAADFFPNQRDCADVARMVETADHLPDDTTALKAALTEARAKLSGAEAIIAHLQLVKVTRPG